MFNLSQTELYILFMSILALFGGVYIDTLKTLRKDRKTMKKGNLVRYITRLIVLSICMIGINLIYNKLIGK